MTKFWTPWMLAIVSFLSAAGLNGMVSGRWLGLPVAHAQQEPPLTAPDEIRLLDLSAGELESSGITITHGPQALDPHITDPNPLKLEVLESPEIEIEPTSHVGFGDWLGYNSTDGDTTWIAGGHDLGMFSMQSYPHLAMSENSGIVTGLGFHFLSGPGDTDMPPRLFDFELAYQTREVRNDYFLLDLKLGVGAFSDFEGSAREGIRFPAHAVAYYEIDPWLVSVLGVDVLDRDDISVLPVAGFVWRANESLLLECVFPKPKILWQVNPACVVYLGGELGGGTWAIERDDFTDDNATYRDLRLSFGIVGSSDSSESVLEFGYAFDRALEYRSGRGDYDPEDAFMVRIRSHY